MNISKYIAFAAAFAAITATSQLGAAVVNITQGSTSGYTMTDGNTYVVQNSVSFSNSTAGGSGMTVAENATVVLYVPAGVTLTAKGGNGSGQTGGGAGIRVPETATLIITGEGAVNATGGNAGNGENGADGTNASNNGAGSGGSGGAGGGGAGAAVGGIGGIGGGNNGRSGGSSETMGKLYVLGNISMHVTGGSNGVAGAVGIQGIAYKEKIYLDNGYSYNIYYGGGGGGGGGGAGASPSCAIGCGGSSGGGGGKGKTGAQSNWTSGGESGCGGESKTANGEGDSSGNAGGAYGAEGGAGTLYVSSTATVDVNRTKLSATTHSSAQYTISFDANGGALSSSTNNATATLGCALPDCIPQPTKDGSVFAGWAADQAGNKMWYGGNGSKSQSSYPVPANTTLYAIWLTSPTWYVDSATGDDLHSGLSWASAKKTIQSAVDCAKDGDTIFVKPGVYKECYNTGIGLYNRHSYNITIKSTDGPSVTILDGDGKRRVIKGTSSATEGAWKRHAFLVNGFTIRNGYNNGPSAVAYSNIRNCIIRDNATYGDLTVEYANLENCLIISNISSNNLQNSTRAKLFNKVEMKNCTVSGNIIMRGDGCDAIGNSKIINSIIYGNDIGGAQCLQLMPV